MEMLLQTIQIVDNSVKQIFNWNSAHDIERH